MTAQGKTLDDYVEAFEVAWRDTAAVDVAAYLPASDDPLYTTVLRELVRIDLELGWQAGQSRCLEDYGTRFPELFLDRESLEQIAFEDYRLRRQAGLAPSARDYARRYNIRTDDWPADEDAPPSFRLEQAARSFRDFRLAGLQAGSVDSWKPSALAGSDAEAFFRGLAAAAPDVADLTARALTTLPQAGGVFADFRLISELGRGAFGRVFLARQDTLASRPVALKVVPAAETEAQTLAQLQHTHIVPIYSVHRDGPLQGVCMPYRGSTTAASLIELAKLEVPATGAAILTHIQSRPRPAGAPDALPPAPAVEEFLTKASYPDAVLWLGARLAEGLVHAHQRGIIHRDIKPANILLGDDAAPMLLDFNIAEDTKQRGLAGAALGGTLPYMAPEQLQAFLTDGTGVDAQADIYSLGIVLFELLTGRFPFPPLQPATGGRIDERIRQLLDDRRTVRPCPRQFNPAISPAAASIVRHCLEPDPARRYGSAALQEDIDRHLRNEPLRHAPNPSAGERCRKWLKRNPGLLLRASVAGGVLLLILACVLTWGTIRLVRAEGARLERIDFRRDYHLAQLLLSTRPPTGDQRREGLEVSRRALKRYEALEDPNWQRRWILTALPASDRDAVRGEIGELLLLMARTMGQAKEGLADAERFHASAAAAFAPDEPLALRGQRAWLLGLAGRKDEEAALRKALRSEKPQTVRERYLAARELVQEGKHREARELLEPASRRAPDDFWVWFLLGVCCDELGRHEQAVTCYSVCIALEPEFAPSHHNRGMAFLRQKRPPEALADFDRAIELSPDRPELYFDRALARAGMGKKHLKQAIADLDESVSRHLPLTRVYFLRARFRAELGDKEGAAKDHAEGMARKPADELSWIARGYARMKDEPKAALADFDEALKLNPRSRPALMNRAHVQAEKLGRQDESKKTLDEVLKHHPDHPPALAGQAVVLARLHQRDAAHRRIGEAMDRDSSGEVRYQAACVYALTSRKERDDAETALTYLRQALEAGYGHDLLATDADLNDIRGRAGFRRLTEAAKVMRSQ